MASQQFHLEFQSVCRSISITPLHDDYGSLSTQPLADFHSLLKTFCDCSTFKTIIVDLSEVSVVGATLLGTLAVLAGDLRRRGQQFIVCGLNVSVRFSHGGY